MSNAERLAVVLADVFSSDEVVVDEALIDRMLERLGPMSAPATVTLMVGPDESFVSRHEGATGLRDGWNDWLEAFAEVRFEVEGIEPVGDNVLTMARQIGRSKVGGPELEQPSAAVWKFRDGLIVQVEFHLDRDRARASAAEPA